MADEKEAPKPIIGFAPPPTPLFTINSDFSVDADWSSIERIATSIIDRPSGIPMEQFEFMALSVFLARGIGRKEGQGKDN